MAFTARTRTDQQRRYAGGVATDGITSTAGGTALERITTSVRRRGSVLLPLFALLVVAGCSSGNKSSAGTPAGRTAAAPATGGVAVDIGWSEPNEPYLGYLAFYPDRLSIHAGDTISFTNYVGHTLTFLPQGATPPQFDVYGFGFPAIGLGPCITQQPVGAATTECPDTTSVQGGAWPDFSGGGFYTTGLLAD